MQKNDKHTFDAKPNFFLQYTANCIKTGFDHIQSCIEMIACFLRFSEISWWNKNDPRLDDSKKGFILISGKRDMKQK